MNKSLFVNNKKMTETGREREREMLCYFATLKCAQTVKKIIL